jgi:hypothetical protein
MTSRHCKPNIWGAEMYTKSSLLLATALTFASVAFAAPVTQFAPRSISRGLDTVLQYDGSGVILVQNRGRGGGGQRAGGGGGQRAAGANRGGNFNTNDFHRDVANSRNTNVNRNATVNRNTNVNANRNVNVNGGCCNGNYDSGPNWGASRRASRSVLSLVRPRIPPPNPPPMQRLLQPIRPVTSRRHRIKHITIAC